MTLLLILEFIAPQPTGILALSFFDFDWLTWLMLWVLSQAETIITIILYLFRKRVVTQLNLQVIIASGWLRTHDFSQVSQLKSKKEMAFTIWAISTTAESCGISSNLCT